LPRLLVVHHTTSPALRAMLEAVVAGARDPELATSGISVEVCPALAANVPDVLAADGFVLGTPVNIGYMSGALKHFFDQVYYPCLGAKAGAPYGFYVHGDNNAAGAVRAVKSIATGLGWAEVVNPVAAVGPVGKDTERQCYELGATVAANLALTGCPHRGGRRDAPIPTMGTALQLPAWHEAPAKSMGCR
jgi:multimeric flavodoxin WrbA